VKLYESPSPNARRVHVFMAEKGIDCERVPVDIRGGENIAPDYLAKNPAGRVPLLELDDGTFIAESVAICRYLEFLHPEPNLFGEPGLAAAQVEMWQRRAEMNFMAEVAGAFRNLTGFFKDRETCVKDWGAVCAEKAPRALAMFDHRLGESDFLAGDRFTIADITLCIALDFARQVKVVTLPELAHLDRWYGHVSAWPSLSPA